MKAGVYSIVYVFVKMADTFQAFFSDCNFPDCYPYWWGIWFQGTPPQIRVRISDSWKMMKMKKERRLGPVKVNSIWKEMWGKKETEKLWSWAGDKLARATMMHFSLWHDGALALPALTPRCTDIFRGIEGEGLDLIHWISLPVCYSANRLFPFISTPHCLTPRSPDRPGKEERDHDYFFFFLTEVLKTCFCWEKGVTVWVWINYTLEKKGLNCSWGESSVVHHCDVMLGCWRM